MFKRRRQPAAPNAAGEDAEIREAKAKVLAALHTNNHQTLHELSRATGLSQLDAMCALVELRAEDRVGCDRVWHRT